MNQMLQQQQQIQNADHMNQLQSSDGFQKITVQVRVASRLNQHDQISLDINDNNTISQLIDTIKQRILINIMQGQSEKQVQFWFDGILDEADNRQISQAGINNGSIIEVRIVDQPENITLKIKNSTTQKQFEIIINKNESVKALVEKIKLKQNDKNNWKYYFNRSLLRSNNKKSLQAIQLYDGAIIEIKQGMVIQEREPQQELPTLRNIIITIRVSDLPIIEKQFQLEIDPKSQFSTLKAEIEKRILDQIQPQDKSVIDQLQYSCNDKVLDKNDNRSLDEIEIVNESIIDIKVLDPQGTQESLRITVRFQSQEGVSTYVTLDLDRVIPLNILMMALKDNFPSGDFSDLSSIVEFQLNESKIKQESMNLSLQDLNVDQGSVIHVKSKKFLKRVLKYELVENEISQIQLNFTIFGSNHFQITISDNATLHVLNQQVKETIAHLQIDQIEKSRFRGFLIDQNDNRTLRELGFRHGSSVDLTFSKFIQN